jgi:hypothetical protein
VFRRLNGKKWFSATREPFEEISAFQFNPSQTRDIVTKTDQLGRAYRDITQNDLKECQNDFEGQCETKAKRTLPNMQRTLMRRRLKIRAIDNRVVLKACGCNNTQFKGKVRRHRTQLVARSCGWFWRAQLS